MKSTVCTFVAVATLFAAGSLHAVLMRTLSIEELSRKADLVVQGVVTNKACLRTAEGRIYTRVDLQISDVIKGSSVSNVFSVVYGGGTIGNERQTVSGQAEYTIGEEVVAFLVLNQRGQAVTIGLCQGKFDVWRDKQTGKKFVRNIFHGAPPPDVSPSTTPVQSAGSTQPSAPLELNELKTQVKQANL